MLRTPPEGVNWGGFKGFLYLLRRCRRTRRDSFLVDPSPFEEDLDRRLEALKANGEQKEVQFGAWEVEMGWRVLEVVY